jgi:hypothetical protein
MSEDDFKKFLKLLSLDEHEAGLLYNRLEQKLVRFFETKGLSDADGAAFKTIERAVKKIAEGAVVPDAEKYCVGIARYIAKEAWRTEFGEMEGAKKALQEWLRDFPEQVTRIYRLLLPCFEELAPDDQKLLIDYCRILKGRARAELRRKLAESLNTTLLGLRMRVTRLRAGLKDCVKRREKTA